MTNTFECTRGWGRMNDTDLGRGRRWWYPKNHEYVVNTIERIFKHASDEYVQEIYHCT